MGVLGPATGCGRGLCPTVAARGRGTDGGLGFEGGGVTFPSVGGVGRGRGLGWGASLFPIRCSGLLDFTLSSSGGCDVGVSTLLAGFLGMA